MINPFNKSNNGEKMKNEDGKKMSKKELKKNCYLHTIKCNR
jgi:hypothetical protein